MSDKPLDCVGVPAGGEWKHDFRLSVERIAEYFYATSPDLAGLLVSEPTVENLMEHVPMAIYQLLQARIDVLTHERDTYKAGFIAAMKVLDAYALHLHVRGGRLEPIPECVAAQRLVDGE